MCTHTHAYIYIYCVCVCAWQDPMVCSELEMALIFDHNEDDESGLVTSSMGMLLVFKSGTLKMKPQLRYGSVFGGGRFYILSVSPE